MDLQVDQAAIRELDHELYEGAPDIFIEFIELEAKYSTESDLFENPDRFSASVRTRQRGLVYPISQEEVEFENTASDKNNISNLVEN